MNFSVHDNNFPRVDDEQVVLLSRREGDLEAVHLGNTVFTSNGRGREGGEREREREREGEREGERERGGKCV